MGGQLCLRIGNLKKKRKKNPAAVSRAEGGRGREKKNFARWLLVLSLPSHRDVDADGDDEVVDE